MERALIDRLPPPLPAERVIAANRLKEDLHTLRRYTWNGWEFTAPPGVFLPGATSRMIHQRILDGDIDVRGRRYVAMGAGLGAEAVAAGLRGAREIYAVDVHPPSVAATEENYRRLMGEHSESTLIPVVADLFKGFPEGVRADVVTFNPPAVGQAVSSDPDVVRNICVGAAILEDFFAQMRERGLLSRGGEIFIVVSNTADMRRIVAGAEETGFTAHVHHRHDWGNGILSHLFRFHDREAE